MLQRDKTNPEDARDESSSALCGEHSHFWRFVSHSKREPKPSHLSKKLPTSWIRRISILAYSPTIDDATYVSGYRDSSVKRGMILAHCIHQIYLSSLISHAHSQQDPATDTEIIVGILDQTNVFLAPTFAIILQELDELGRDHREEEVRRAGGLPCSSVGIGGRLLLIATGEVCVYRGKGFLVSPLLYP